MARIHFPGRPGHHFNQIRVAYSKDDMKNSQDPSLAFLPQFRQGLQAFRDLVGPSDEEDEFEGFSEKDITKSEKRLKEVQRKDEVEDNEESENKDIGKIHRPGKRFSRSKRHSGDGSDPETSYRTRNKLKAVVEKSYQDMLKEGFTSHGNAHCVVSMTPLSSKTRGLVPTRKTKLKFDKKTQKRSEIHGHAPKVKKTEKDMAKFLLEKAKLANLLQQQAKARRLAAAASNKVVQRKEFVLPTQSSRSSRVIIPNKRFLEDDSVTSPVLKKRRSLDSDSNSDHPIINKTPTKSDGTMASPVKTSVLFEKPLGSLEQPLIIDGKRDRKPSVKILEKIVDNGDKGFESFKILTSPIAAPKLGKILFPASPGPPVTFQKASESQKFGMFGSSRKQGVSIVQKAKLQLNRAALNKSKAALARSLRAEMNREAKLAEIEKQSHELPLGSSNVQSSQAITDKQTVSKRKPTCVICGLKGKTMKKSGNTLKTDVIWCYKKFYVCQACMGFYARSRNRSKKNVTYKCVGADRGRCKISGKIKMCQFCRILQYIELGFPHAEMLRTLVGNQLDEQHTEGLQKGKETGLRKQTASTVHTRHNVSEEDKVRMDLFRPETNVSVKKEDTGDEISPLKETDLRRRRRTSKETLKSPIDKGKMVDTIPDPEPSTSQPEPEESGEEASPQSVSRGPRIKHVCRNAAVVLGKTPAMFPGKSEFRLSALPKKEKVEIWKQDEEVKAAASADSDDDRPMEEIIEKSSTGQDIIIRKQLPEVKEKNIKKLVGPGGIKLYKRKMRCKKCVGCLATDCGQCKHCLDKVKFGGRNVWKKSCVQRGCANPLIQRSATAAFINPKSSLTADSGTESNTDSVHSSPVKLTRVSRQIERLRDNVGLSELEMCEKASTSVPISINESQCQTVMPTVEPMQDSCTQVDDREIVPITASSSSCGSGLDVSRRIKRTEVRKLEFDSGQNIQLEHIRSKQFGKLRSKVKEKIEIQQKYTKNQGNNNDQCYPVMLVDPASRQWGSALSQPKYHPIKVDYKGESDVNRAWSYGIAVTMSSAMSVRTLCFLCASSGKHELVFCNICCEPFHKFCLEEFEQPVKGHDADWCCARCQFCSVCGRQNNLLQCDKCQNMYHPECLGPNYPTKPTKGKKIWICTKCVKCKSCGATTPGTACDATWTYDFSLCYDCGKLMDKGNFCPICHKCYSDDDWESKMIQCNMCESWVHSNCEGLTDEMYEILSSLPEDLSFYCQRCSPSGCPEWMKTLRQELRLGLENIMQTLILTKCSQYIIKRETKAVMQKQILGADVAHSQQETNSSVSHMAPCVSKLNTHNDHNDIKLASTLSDSKDVSVGGSISSLSEEAHCKTADGSMSVIGDNGNKTVGHDLTKSDPTLTAGCIHLTQKTGGDISKSETNDSIRLKNGNVENVKSDTRTTCDKVDGRSNCENTGEVICDSLREQAPSVGDVAQGIVGPTDVKSCEKVVDDVNDSSVTGLGVLGDIECKRVKTRESGSNTDQVKTESSQTSSDINQVIRTPSAGSMTKCITDVVRDQKGDILSDSKQDKSTSLDTKRLQSQVVPVKHHVHFNIAGNTVVESSEQTNEPSYPRDLMEIAEKMKTGFYKSVVIFSEDILRIIQEYLDDDEETRVTRKKSIQSARQVFVKQMEKIFPWFKIKECRYWYSNRYIPDGMLPDATLPPTIDHTYAQWLRRTELPKSPQPSPFKRTQTPIKKFVPLDEEDGEIRTFLEGDDTRRCLLCLQYGDQDSNDAGRLLYCGQDDWAHVNCALWSAEVYEDEHGALKNLVEAYSRGKMLKCDFCGLAGATVGCNTRGCKSNYHFMCARDDYCKFQEDKKVFCKYHTMDVDGELLDRNRFTVLRRVFVGCLNVRTVKKNWARGLNVTDINVLIGSCCIEALGRLTDLSDKPRFLQPVDFVSTRIYWSTKDVRKRCVYTCRIVEVRPEKSKSPTVKMKDTRIVHDESDPDFVPFSRLDLTSYNLGHLRPTLNRSESFLVDLTVGDTPDTSATLSATQESEALAELSNCTDLQSLSHARNVTRSSSFNGVESKKVTNKKDPLSLSWSGTEKPQFQSQVNLKGLSPHTLRLLNIKNPQEHKIVFNENKEDDLSLLKIANRLNSAAARCSKPSICLSDITESSLSPLSKFHSQKFQRNRSRSFDSLPASYNADTNENNKISLIPATLVNVPWTPPYRLSMRANSWPKEGQSVIPEQPKIDLKPSTSNEDKYNSGDKNCELMDIDPMSEPIGCSSPKVIATKLNKGQHDGSKEEQMEMTVDLDNCTATQDEDGVIHLEGNADGITETTFVVMTDTSEEISEEEAIKLVQEALSGSSVIENDGSIVTAETSTDEKGTAELVSDQNTEQTSKESIDKTETNVTAGQLTYGERSNSPFIPQFVPSDDLSEKPRRNTFKDIQEKEDENSYMGQNITTISDDSEFDSDVLDITDSVNTKITEINKEYNDNSQVTDIPNACESDSTKEHMLHNVDVKNEAKRADSVDSIAKTKECSNVKCAESVDQKSSKEGQTLMNDSLPSYVFNKDEVDGDHHTDSLTLPSKEVSDQTMEQACLESKSAVTYSSVDDALYQPMSDNDAGIAALEDLSGDETTMENKSEEIKKSNNDVAIIDIETTEIDPHKKQVLRGLGLGTSDEVEQIKKNSPPKKVSCLNAFATLDCGTTKKQKQSPSKLIKKYPLRRKRSSGISDKDNSLSSGDQTIHSDSFSPKANEKRERKDIGTMDGRMHDGNNKTKLELPVLDPIAKKIKEESLAKSCPEEKGPFKCQTCRRMYRTATSYQIHVKNCNFNVSSSDEEDDSESSKVSQSDSSQGRRSIRSKSKYAGEGKGTTDVINSNQKVHHHESVIESDSSEHVESLPRSSLRKSTIYQRVAMEVEERRLKEEAQLLTSPKRRGRKSLAAKIEDGSEHTENIANNVDSQTPENRRATRRSCDLQQEHNKQVRLTRNSIKDQNHSVIDKTENEIVEDAVTTTLGKRLGRRRRRDTSTDSDTEPSKSKLNRQSSSENKRRTRSAGTVEIVDDIISHKNINFYTENILCKSKKGKSRLQNSISADEERSNVVVTENMEDSAKKDGCLNKCDIANVSDDRLGNELDEKISDKSMDTSSDSRNDPILDYVSGLIIDKKTGMIYSPTKKSKTDAALEFKRDKASGEDITVNDSSQSVIEVENVSDTNTLSETAAERTDEHVEDKDSLDKRDTNDKGSFVDLTSEGDFRNAGIKESFCVKSDEVKDENSNMSNEVIKSAFDELESASGIKESMVSIENNSDMSKSELSKTVLQYLKKGHKVVIKNSTCDKSYIWEKTENGYVGKPLDKNAHDAVKENATKHGANQQNSTSHTVCKEETIADGAAKQNSTTHTICKEKTITDQAARQNTTTPITETKAMDENEWEQCMSSQGNTQKSGTSQEQLKSLTASETLAVKKIQDVGEKAERLRKENEGNNDNRKACISLKPKTSPTRRILPANAEYMGGIILSRPTSSFQPDDTTKRKILNTAEVANTALQASLQIKNTFVGATVSEVYHRSNHMQSLVQFVNSNSLIPNVNPVMNYPLTLQNLYPPSLGQFPMNLNAMPRPSVGNSILAQSNNLNSAMNQTPVIASLLHQTATRPMSMLQVNNSTNIGPRLQTTVQNSVPNIGPRLQTTVQNSVPNIGPRLQTTVQNSVPNILKKQQSSDHTFSKSTVKQRNHFIKSSFTVEKMKQYFSKRNEIPIKESLKRFAQREKGIATMGRDETFERRSAITSGVRIVKLTHNNKGKLPMKDNYIYVKKQKKKRLQKKVSINSKSHGRSRNTSRIAAPHTSAKVSHPIIHAQKENCQLPVAAVEEEIHDIPLSTMMELENRRNGLQNGGHSLGRLEYEITSDDGFSCKAETLDGAWKQVMEKVQDARIANRFKQLSYTGLSGLEMFALSHPNVVYLIEQLSGAGYCRRYKFKYHKHEPTEQEVELLNPSGCIRSEPFSGRNPWDMFSFLMSRYRMMPERSNQVGNEEMAQKSSRRATSMDLPMAMRFRKLKAFSRECVGVYRSLIHGRGLFCKRHIDAGEMIIEYAGEVIRNSMTDSREKYYEGKGIGCYMFRIDDKDVVDATMRGSAARFINHSCEPNCYSKVITVDNRKHIVIFALKQIFRGEELTYDYKFPIEEIKIPCTCGSVKCRRYLN